MGITLSQAPHIALLIDEPNWAFHTIAKAIHLNLIHQFTFDILARRDFCHINDTPYDIVHILFESETKHRKFLTGHARIVKSVFSHYWELDGLSPEALYDTYLREAHVLTVPSMKLLKRLNNLPPPIHLFAEGVDTDVFAPQKIQRGPLIIGWAGNPARYVKRLPWIEEACHDLCELKLATGNLNQEEMVQFYNEIDIIACASYAEGSPRPLLEGMACGAFPVTFNIGIAPELIESDLNGIIVQDVSMTGLRNAFSWCKDHLDYVRIMRHANTERIRATRNWKQTTQHLTEVYTSLL